MTNGRPNIPMLKSFYLSSIFLFLVILFVCYLTLSSYCMLVQVRVVLKRTVVDDSSSITWTGVIFWVKRIEFVSQWCYKSRPLKVKGQFSLPYGTLYTRQEEGHLIAQQAVFPIVFFLLQRVHTISYRLSEILVSSQKFHRQWTQSRALDGVNTLAPQL